jgi:hypothetical protein
VPATSTSAGPRRSTSTTAPSSLRTTAAPFRRSSKASNAPWPASTAASSPRRFSSANAVRGLLDGICKEAAEILKTKRISPQVFGVMKKMKPMRQIEVADLLVAASNFSVPYTRALLAATRPNMLVDPDKKAIDGLSPEQAARHAEGDGGLIQHHSDILRAPEAILEGGSLEA